MKRIKYWIRNHFGFSQKETNGFIVLVMLMVMLLFIPGLYKYFFSSSYDNYAADKKMLDSMVYQMKIKADESSTPSLVRNTSVSHFYFDPNIVSEKDLEKIFGKPFGKRIISYRTKGGKFIIKSDLLKIYNLPEDIYNKWKNFILLPEENNNNYERVPVVKNNENYSPLAVFDINKADTIQLEKVKGIGVKLSARIIKYKDKLGGFISEDQYSEVFGLDSNALFELKKYSYIEKNFIPSRININTATFLELSSHPYIGRKNASIIINYRTQHGNFQSLESLKTIRAIDEKQLNKIITYISL